MNTDQKRSARLTQGRALKRDNFCAADVELTDKLIDCLLENRELGIIGVSETAKTVSTQTLRSTGVISM
jgi:hypothetical protein